MNLAGHLQIDRAFGNYWKLTAAQRSFLIGKSKDTGEDTEEKVKVVKRLSMKEMQEMTDGAAKKKKEYAKRNKPMRRKKPVNGS